MLTTWVIAATAGLLGRPVSEYGRLCHGDGGHEGGARCRRALMLPTLSGAESSNSTHACFSDEGRAGRVIPSFIGPEERVRVAILRQ